MKPQQKITVKKKSCSHSPCKDRNPINANLRIARKENEMT